jgi:predicted nucleotidyltransferase
MKRVSKILIRIPEEQHRALKEHAARSKRSLNAACVLALEASLARESFPPSAHRERDPGDPVPVDTILAEFEPDLVGIVLFGSVARGSAGEGSDIDLLLVLHPSGSLNRDLYHRWDTFARRTGISKRLSPHFCRLAESCESTGSLWFEVALEGIVLWEREWTVSRFLARMRHYMLENNVRRKLSYGVPYWVKGNAEQQTGRRLSQEGGTAAQSS